MDATTMEDRYIEELLRSSWQPRPPEGMRGRVLARARAAAQDSRPPDGLAWLRDLGRLAVRPRRRAVAALATVVVLASACIVASVVRADPQVLLERGRELYKAGDYAAAIETLKEVPSDSPVSYEALATLGECYQNKKEYKKAAESFLQAAESPDVRFANEQTLKAVECLRLDDRADEAAAVLRRRIEEIKDHETEREMRGRLGALYLDIKRYDEGIAVFKELLSKEQSPSYWIAMGDCYRGKREVYQAVECYREVTKVAEHHVAVEGYSKMVDCLSSGGRPREAIPVTQEWIQSAKAAEDEKSLQLARKSLGGMYRDSGQLDNAIAVFQELIAGNVDRPDGCMYAIGTCYQLKGEHAKAIEWFEKCAQYARSIGDSVEQEARMMVVLSMRKLGKAAEAQAYAEKAYKEERPERLPRLVLLHGELLMSDGNDLEGAIPPLRKLVAEFPNHPLAQTGREYLAAALEKTGRVNEAIGVVRDIVAAGVSREEKARLTGRIADMYFRTQQYSEASKAFRDILRLSGATQEQKARATYHVALCYSERGHAKIAQDYMWRVARRWPESNWAAIAKGKLYLWGALQSGTQAPAAAQDSQ